MHVGTMLLPDGRQVTVTHLLVRAADGKEGHLACAPNADAAHTDPYQNEVKMRSDDVRAVNCPLCKGSDDFRRAAELLGLAR